MRQVEVGDILIGPVHRQHVLHKIIGPDAEKIAGRSQFVQDLQRGGQLDHHPQPGFPIELHSFGRKSGDAPGDLRLRLPVLVERGDHGKRSPDRTGAGAEDGPQLLPENGGLAAGKNGRTHPRKGFCSAPY